MRAKVPAWAPPLLALQFLTRVPAPGLGSLPPAVVRTGLQQAVGWFPLVGTLVGLVTATILSLADLCWPRAVAVVIALIAEARLTGAFHEDAVADFCDGLGGGRDSDHVRTIMKDSRVGSYGALGLMLALMLRASLLWSLDPAVAAIAIIASATFGRLMATLAMAVIPAVPVESGLAKDIGGAISQRHALLALATSAPGLILLALDQPLRLTIAAIAGLGFLLWFRGLLLRRIGGSTGDCLGFAAYAGQIILLLVVTR